MHHIGIENFLPKGKYISLSTDLYLHLYVKHLAPKNIWAKTGKSLI